MERVKVKKYMLGLDIGTTNVKAALYNSSGEEMFVKTATYHLYTNEVGAATQSAKEIRDKVFEVLKESATEAALRMFPISFISLSSAMHSLTAVNKEGEPILPVFTFGDRQAESMLSQLSEVQVQGLYHRTGTPIHPMSPLLKLMWLQQEHRERFAKAHKFLGIKSYILAQLFGDYYTDYSIANATGLFNMHTLTWDEEALALASVIADKLPKLVPTTTTLKGMKIEVAEELGFSSDIPVIIGASDGCLANLGVYAIEPGQVALTIGTSGAIRTVVDQPMTDEKGRTFCYALTENHWVVGGPVNNGGVVIDWARSRFLEKQNNHFGTLMHEIETVNPGADGLFFHPYLLGERSPIWRSDAKGSFFGLDMHHQNGHLLRAVLEGVNMNLYSVSRAVAEVIGNDAKEFLVTGGFTNSDTWLENIADIFGATFTVTDITENACIGAVMLGMLAIGEIEDFSEIRDWIPVSKRIQPNSKKHAFYQEHYKKYEIINAHSLAILDELKI